MTSFEEFKNWMKENRQEHLKRMEEIDRKGEWNWMKEWNKEREAEREERNREREADHLKYMEQMDREREADHQEHLKRMDEIKFGPPFSYPIITHSIPSPHKKF